MTNPRMRSFWVDFPVTTEQYSKLQLRWRRRLNYYEIQNPPPDLNLLSFCTFGGDDYEVISLEIRGDVDTYYQALETMEKWIAETLGA